jgi:hypothetical protein
MSWFYNIFKRDRTTIEGDTLKVEDVDYVDMSDQAVETGALTPASVAATGAVSGTDITGSGALSGATVSDAGGRIRNRLYIHEFTAMDLSAAGATLIGPRMAAAAQIANAYYVVGEEVGAGADTAAVQLGTIDADETTGGDADAHVLGTTDAANGLIPASAPVGTVQALTLGGASAGAIAAGKVLTATHIQDADVAGTIKVIVEYYYT